MSTRARRSKIRVFVIEDHAATARSLKMYLEAVGFTVQVAFDVKSALQLAPNIEFDVAICDLNLPDGTGWELLERLKKQRSNFAAIAFSAFDEPHHVERSRAAGFLAHLVKGAPAEELTAAIRNAAAQVANPAATAPAPRVSPPNPRAKASLRFASRRLTGDGAK